MTETLAKPPRLLLAEALGIQAEALAENAQMDAVPEWDSFGHLQFMLELEKHFGIAINDASIAACRSLSGACAYLKAQQKQWKESA